MVTMIYWTGIGSRETPDNVLLDMENIGRLLGSKLNTCLRSGAADGADTAFELGCYYAGGNSEIYLPWKGFNKDSEQRKGLPESDLWLDNLPIQKWRPFAIGALAQKFHPKWNILRHGAKMLHTRNVFQILGKDLKSQSDFVICWTKDGLASGGTGQALRIAEYYRIPIYNLYNALDHEMLMQHIGTIP